MAYEDEKEFAGATYRGMKVGGSHLWTYPEGKWTERKITPQRWDVAFTSLKRRRRRAPEGSGAEVGSGYHWLVVAHQWAGKLDANTYATHLEGSKHLVSFRKPGWQGWTTQQRGHTSARLRTIAILEELIEELRDLSDGEFEDPRDEAALTSLIEDSNASPDDASPPQSEPLVAPKSRRKRTGSGTAPKAQRSVTRPQRVRRERRVIAAPATRTRRSSPR